MIEIELNSGGACGKNFHWIAASLLGGVAMGTGGYLYASNYAEFGLAANGLLGPGAFIFYLFIKVFRESKHKVKTGTWFKKESAWIKSDSSVRWNSLIPLSVNVTTNIGWSIIMTYAWDFAGKANLN